MRCSWYYMYLYRCICFLAVGFLDVVFVFLERAESALI